jgi:hypothetical protein
MEKYTKKYRRYERSPTRLFRGEEFYPEKRHRHAERRCNCVWFTDPSEAFDDPMFAVVGFLALPLFLAVVVVCYAVELVVILKNLMMRRTEQCKECGSLLCSLCGFRTIDEE